MRNNPFFIVGVGRSGTTLLRLLLHNHPRIAIPYEFHNIPEYFKNRDKYGDLREESNLIKMVDDLIAEPSLKFWDHDIDKERILSRIKDKSLGGVINEIYMDYAAGKGKMRWGDKSNYVGAMHIINKIFPEAQFIHIIRDGRDVAASVMKLAWGPNDIIQASEWWSLFVLLGKRMGSILGKERYLEVKYEDLLSDFEKKLRMICDFLGEEYSSEMLNYYLKSDKSIPESKKKQHYKHDSPPDTSRVQAWKKDMHPYDVALFNRNINTRALLEELGYEISADKYNKLRLAFRMSIIMIKRFVFPIR